LVDLKNPESIISKGDVDGIDFWGLRV